jgi:hypothetical protein
MWRLDAVHQASEAERGRVRLAIFLMSDHLSNSVDSLFLNWKIPFHAEPRQNDNIIIVIDPLFSGCVTG